MQTMRASSRSAFAARSVTCKPTATNRARVVSVKAIKGQWPDPEFTQAVLAAFPEQGIANVEEARVRTAVVG